MGINHVQPQLFPDASQPPVAIDAVAARIGANAPKIEHEDRTSAAARDQGWGPIDTSGHSTGQENTAVSNPVSPGTTGQGLEKKPTGPHTVAMHYRRLGKASLAGARQALHKTEDS